MSSLFPEDGPVSKDQLRKHLPGPVANVQGFGARGDGLVDDTVAIQAAIDHVAGHGGGIVYLPAGTYKIKPQVSIAVDRLRANALRITADNITLTGDGPALTRLVFRVFGDQDPTDRFEMFPWYAQDGTANVWRGSAIYITGGADAANPRHDIVIENMEIDGGAKPGNTWDRTWPPGTQARDGWDISHKGIHFQEDLHHRHIQIRNVHAHDFRGEIVYGGGPFIDAVTIENCELSGTSGDCLSLSASQMVRGCNFHDAAHACVEGFQFAKLARYIDNQFSNARIGMNIHSAWDSANPVDISGNFFSDCADAGIAMTVENGVTLISNNRFVDCGTAQGQHAALIIDPGRGNTAPAIGGIVVRDNHFLRHGRDGGAGIALGCRAGRRLKSVVISGNFIGSSGAGAERNRRFVAPISYAFATGADVDGVVISKNIYFRTQRHVENALRQGEGGPMPAMFDNQAIGFDDAANSVVASDGRSLVRLPNEGPVNLSPSGEGDPMTPRLNPADYAQGQKLVLTNGNPARRLYLPQSSDVFECAEGRYLSPGVFITLIRDRDKLREIDYQDRRSRHYAEVTQGTDIAADGFRDVYISVPSERRFVTFSGIGHGTHIRVIATNRNVTISNNENIQLHSNADYEMVENEVKNFVRTRDGMLREI